MLIPNLIKIIEKIIFPWPIDEKIYAANYTRANFFHKCEIFRLFYITN